MTHDTNSEPEEPPESVDADVRVESFRQTRNNRRTELVEDYVELVAELIDRGGEARQVDIAQHLGVAQPTVAKMLKRLVADGLVQQRPYRGVFLTEEELEKIERIRFRKHEDRIERIKDIFLIAVYTGLRFSDVTNLTASKITQTVNGLVLTLKAEKTGKALILPLYALFQVKGARVSKPEEIIYKYLHWVDGLDAPEEAEKIPFFRITNQYMNRALKVLAVRAGIRKEITSHVARRTFATIMATKVKTPVLQRLLQHSRPDMTNIYVQLSNRVIENELKKIDWQ